MTTKFIIAEFNDGLQLIPALWYNADKKSCIWPSHFKSKFRINKAIITKEMPTNNMEWDELSIKRIFGVSDTYEEGMEKLVLAEDTSNIDMSSDGLHEHLKKKRRITAKKTFLSSTVSSDEDSDEDLDLNKNKENYVTSNKILLDYPQITDFVSSNKLHTNRSLHNSTNVLCKKTNTLSDDNRNINTTVSINNVEQNSTEKSNKDGNIENIYTREYKNLVIGKLNKVLYKLKTIENKIDIFEEKIQPSTSSNEENIELPISTFEELKYFEEQLHEIQFKNEVLNIFHLVGGYTPHAMIRNILKKAVTDNFGQNFSWAGKKTKKSFQDLGLAQIIIQAVRKTHNHITDNEIGNYIAKWLAQATLRVQRAK